MPPGQSYYSATPEIHSVSSHTVVASLGRSCWFENVAITMAKHKALFLGQRFSNLLQYKNYLECLLKMYNSIVCSLKGDPEI